MTKASNVSDMDEARTGANRNVQELSGHSGKAFEPDVAGILGNLLHRLATGIKAASKANDRTGTIEPILEKPSAWAEAKAAMSSSAEKIKAVRDKKAAARIPYAPFKPRPSL